jgi:hypothetical protein
MNTAGRLFPNRGSLAALLLITLIPGAARCQITPRQANEIRAGLENRIEALTILGGDFGLASGSFKSDSRLQPGRASTHVVSDVNKGGGAGEVGDPRPIGSEGGIAWQPRIQGNMGYLEATNLPLEGVRASDSSVFKTYAIEFGGGARIWLTDRFSFAPTFMALYGHTSNEYLVRSAFMKANLAAANRLGLINWSVDTWTLRPALNLQYLLKLGRTIVTISSDPSYFRTESFHSSNSKVDIDGSSGAVANTLDVDVPIGMKLFGHELRSGGYLSRTSLSGDLRTGLGVDHINEVHGRLVLDFLNQLWKVQWIGIGSSYYWGTNITGWAVGADVAFHF